MQLAAAEVPKDLGNRALRVADDDRVEVRQAERRKRAGEDASEDRLRAAPPPVVRDLPRAIEIGVQRADEEERIVLTPVRVAPCVEHDVDARVGRQQRRNQRTDLRLQEPAIRLALAIGIHVGRDDPDLWSVFHRCSSTDDTLHDGRLITRRIDDTSARIRIPAIADDTEKNDIATTAGVEVGRIASKTLANRETAVGLSFAAHTLSA